MRIVHTADWHLGKSLEGRDRLPEQVRFLDELERLCADGGIHLVLVAGDVFQTANPSAAAEDLFYDALDRLADHGRRAVVVIAGNHDQPERLCVAAPLAERLGITLLGTPGQAPPAMVASGRVSRPAAGPGWFELAVPGCPHPAIVAAVPYPSEGRLREVLTDLPDDVELGRAYARRVKELFRQLAGTFRPEAVNLAVSHLYATGGIRSESESPIEQGGACAVAPESLPAGAHYIALGHLHRPQAIRGAPGPARYAGSPLAYSFSEVGHAKSVTLVEAIPGEPARLEEIPLSAGRPLVCWKATAGLAQVEAWLDEGRDPEAWIDLVIRMPGTLTLDQIQRLRERRPGLVHIRLDPEIATGEGQPPAEDRRLLSAEQLFTRYFEQCNPGRTPDDRLVKLFLELMQGEEPGGPDNPEEETL